MARIRNRFAAGIIDLFKSLAGSYNEELDDERGYDKEELERINRLSGDKIDRLVAENGEQTMTLEEEGKQKGRGTDRLGIEKPQIDKKGRKARRSANNEPDKPEQLEQPVEKGFERD